MYSEELKNFRLLGHDTSAAWGGGSLVEVRKGFAYVGAVGGSSYDGKEGFTVHDVRDPRNAAARCSSSWPRRASTCTSCASSATISCT